MLLRGLHRGSGVFMTKLEAWKAWHEAIGIGMEATEHALEKGSHGKAFSYAWDAAVKAEREQCKEWIATWVEDWCEGWSAKKIAHCIRGDGNDIEKPNKYVTREEPL